MVLLLGVVGAGAFELCRMPSFAAMKSLATQPVSESSMMRTRMAEAKAAGRKLVLRQQWVPLDRIAPTVVSATVASEDARFFEHRGLDFREMHAAIRTDVASARTSFRGASTLSQQVVKNLYLSEERSVRRKLQEALLTRRLEKALKKDEILAIYLNIAEWGDGIFGIEAAAQHYLRKSAAELNFHEAAVLVAMLPNPRRLAPDQRPAELHRRTLRVLRRLEEERLVRPDELANARVALQRWLGKPAAIN